MKRSPLRKVGKIGDINLDARRKIATQCFELGIEYCEINFPGCMNNFGVAPAHRHKRVFYINKPGLLEDRSEWLVLDVRCHDMIECSKELTEIVFGITKDKDYIYDEQRAIEALEKYEHTRKNKDGILRVLRRLWESKA